MSKPSPNHKRKEKWSAADKQAAFRIFVETESVRETARRTTVPLGTLAGWLDNPEHAAAIERLRTAHARAIAEDDHRLAREAAAGLREGVAVCRGLLARRHTEKGTEGQERIILESDGKEAAALTRALLATNVELHRRRRLESGESTQNLTLDIKGVKDEAAAIDDELKELLGSAAVRKSLKRMAASSP